MDDKYATAMDANALLCLVKDISEIPQIDSESMKIIEEAQAILLGVVLSKGTGK